MSGCYNANDSTPLATVTSTVKITGLPYDYNGKLHTGQAITPTYNATTGEIYWDIVQGATVKFEVPTLGIDDSGVIPFTTTARLIDILE